MYLARKFAGAAITAALLTGAIASSPAGADAMRSHRESDHEARGSTIVTLDQQTIGAVVKLGVTPTAVKPGTLESEDGRLLAAFPITSVRGGLIAHSGGLKLNGAGKHLALTEYVVDAAKGVLTADARLGSKDLGRIPLFDLTIIPNTDPKCVATAELALDHVAAGALQAVFNAPDLTKAHFGTACVAPNSEG